MLKFRADNGQFFNFPVAHFQRYSYSDSKKRKIGDLQLKRLLLLTK